MMEQIDSTLPTWLQFALLVAMFLSSGAVGALVTWFVSRRRQAAEITAMLTTAGAAEDDADANMIGQLGSALKTAFDRINTLEINAAKDREQIESQGCQIIELREVSIATAAYTATLENVLYEHGIPIPPRPTLNLA